MTAAPDVACRTSFSSQTVESSKSLQSSLDANAHVSGGGWGVSFSASAGYKQASSSVKSGKYKLILSTASCKYYFAKLNELDLPEFSPELLQWIDRMHKSIDARGVIDDSLVYDFVNYFGTHFPSDMVYGARFTYENKITSSNYKTMSSSELSVEVQASYSGLFSVGGGFGLSSSQQQAASNFSEKSETSTISIGAPPPYTGDAMTWASTVKDTPVPVQFNLIPIYELFDDRRLNVQSHFSAETNQIIRDKIAGIASKYCRKLLSEGVEVQCNDDSVIKIEDYAMRYVGIVGGHALNTTLDECISECMKRKDCVMTTVFPDDHEQTRQGNRCILDDDDERRRYMLSCPGCQSFIMPNSLHRAMGLRNLRYDSSVNRLNKMMIKGTESYDQILEFCSIVCSSDPRCVGFEVSTATYYNYNCATYSEHTSKFVYADDYDFETQIMPDLAKRNYQEDYLNDMIITMHGLTTKTEPQHGYATDVCNEVCSSNFNCLMSATISDSQTSCINRNNEQNSGYISFFASQNATTTIYTERALGGWVNISLPHDISDSLGSLNSYNHSWMSAAKTADECGRACSEDVLCRFSSWKSTGHCEVYTSHAGYYQFWLSSYRRQLEITVNPGTIASNEVEYKLMIPNHRAKMQSFLSVN